VDTIEKIQLTETQSIHIQLCDWDDNPRDWENLGTITYTSTRYTLGDEQYKTHDEFLLTFWDEVPEHVLDSWGHWDWFWEASRYSNLPENVRDVLTKVFEENHIFLPVYAYIHSGIVLNTTGFHCPWDSGQTGVIYVSKKDVKDEWGWQRLTRKRVEFIQNILRNEIEIFSDYVEGNVYQFVVKCDLCEEDLDSSAQGFYGYDWEKNGILDEAYPTPEHKCLEPLTV
jgi:hypothetical protein